jgi:hypothetical protein
MLWASLEQHIMGETHGEAKYAGFMARMQKKEEEKRARAHSPLQRHVCSDLKTFH